jgi:hypothetical protein
MAIFHVEVHSRDRQIEHYIVPACANEGQAMQAVKQFFADKGQQLGLWDKDSDRNSGRIQYLIFNVTELPNEPVIFIAGEYRTQYPI